MDYLTRTRLEAATRLLTLQPELSVTEIAFRCGFQSSQYFSKVFRKQHGHSLSEHRSRHLDGAECIVRFSVPALRSNVAHKRTAIAHREFWARLADRPRMQ